MRLYGGKSGHMRLHGGICGLMNSLLVHMGLWAPWCCMWAMGPMLGCMHLRGSMIVKMKNKEIK